MVMSVMSTDDAEVGPLYVIGLNGRTRAVVAAAGDNDGELLSATWSQRPKHLTQQSLAVDLSLEIYRFNTYRAK